MGGSWQAYKKSQNGTWVSNEGRPCNVQGKKKKLPKEGLYPKEIKREKKTL